jgi:hypothetical protein
MHAHGRGHQHDQSTGVGVDSFSRGNTPPAFFLLSSPLLHNSRDAEKGVKVTIVLLPSLSLSRQLVNRPRCNSTSFHVRPSPTPKTTLEL